MKNESNRSGDPLKTYAFCSGYASGPPQRSKADENGLAPIYARLTIDGARIEFSLGKKVLPDKWLTRKETQKKLVR
ncbi:Arm DNA-binding domain-containing protein [Runella sp.]|uniref:Arm DNA-binding domain-containing protein n=1 Tax=Runella sp. TaxID=1960881 RepID=UPI0038F67504